MIVVYDATGRIQYTVDEPVLPNLFKTYKQRAKNDANFRFLQTDEPSIVGRYVNLAQKAPVFAVRPENPVRLNQDGYQVGDVLQFEDMPKGANVYVDGALLENADEPQPIEDAGTYNIIVKAWPFLDKEFTLEVTNGSE